MMAPILLLLCLTIAVSQGCVHEEAVKDLDLSKIAGTFVESEITENPPITDCMEYTIVYEPKDKTILIHGHFYDIGLGKWDIFSVTFEQHPTDKTAFLPNVITEKPSSVSWKSIASSKIIKADKQHLVWSLCLVDGTDMIMINRAKNYTEDESTLHTLMREYNKIPELAKFHSITDQKRCEAL